MTTAYLAFGSNLGDRAVAIASALDRLAALGVAVRARSPLYETDPVTPDPQPLFLNAAARVETSLSAPALLDGCRDRAGGLGGLRPAGRPQAPRLIDIDLLLFGAEVVRQGPSLIVPHPRLLQRPFVRIPLAEVAERGLTHPLTAERLDRAPPDPAVRRLPGSGWNG
jgi:2-amino-4-hydroxy-6-hydroxymethyldihydropteridine diphosphokinase